MEKQTTAAPLQPEDGPANAGKHEKEDETKQHLLRKYDVEDLFGVFPERYFISR